MVRLKVSMRNFSLRILVVNPGEYRTSDIVTLFYSCSILPYLDFLYPHQRFSSIVPSWVTHNSSSDLIAVPRVIALPCSSSSSGPMNALLSAVR